MTSRDDIDSSLDRRRSSAEVVAEGGERLAVASPCAARRRSRTGCRRGRRRSTSPSARTSVASTSTAQRSPTRRSRSRSSCGTTSNRLARVVAQRLVDLVGDAQLGQAQHGGLPQREDVHGEPVVDVVDVDRAVAGRRSGGQQPGDVAEHVEHGLAADLGRVGGDHRHDEQVVDRAAGSPSASTPAGGQVVERRRQAADLRPRAVRRGGSGGGARGGRPRRCWPAAASQPNARIRCSWSSIERPASVVVQRAERAATVAPGVDGALADALDELEHVVAGLVPHDLAEQPAEQADVLADRGVLAGIGLRAGPGVVVLGRASRGQRYGTVADACPGDGAADWTGRNRWVWTLHRTTVVPTVGDHEFDRDPRGPPFDAGDRRAERSPPCPSASGRCWS